MFYVLNTKDGLKNNDPYKVAIKGLINEIKELKLDEVEVTCGGNDVDTTAMDLMISWIISSPEEITAKSLEKRLKLLYKEFSVEELYYMYIATLNDVLAEDFIIKNSENNGIDLKVEVSNYNELIVGLKLKGLMGSLALYALVLKEQLLEKRIDSVNVEEDHNKTRFIRSIRKESFSLYKGVRGMPLLSSKEEAEMLYSLNSKFANEGYSSSLIEYTKTMYTYRCLEKFVALYTFGNDISKFVELKDFIGEESYRIRDYKVFSSPAEVLNARKVVPSEEGVVLKMNNHKSIEAIYLSECSRFNFRMIYGVVKYIDGAECPISLRLNYNSIVTLSCYNVVDVMSILIDYYRIPEEKLTPIGEINKVGEYEVLPGSYWKLKNVGYETESEKERIKSGKKMKRDYTTKVGTYVRSIKGNPSEEAKNFAKQLRIELSEGNTLIKEKGRTYFRSVKRFGIE